MTSAAKHSAIVWVSPEQVLLARAVALAAGLEIVGAGSPEVTRGAAVASELESKHLDSLTKALASTDAELVIIGAPGDFAALAGAATKSSDVEDAEALRACRERGVKIVSLEPLPASVLQLDEPSLTMPDADSAGVVLGQSSMIAAASSASGTPSEWAAFCPLARLSRSVREAAELIAQLGPIRVVAVESLAGAGQGSLGARLYDACEVAVWLLGAPDNVDGAFAPPPRSRARGLHSIPGETLRNLDGDMTVNLRFADGRAASIVASNYAGRWMRTITLLGEQGRLRIYDDGFAWYSSDGRLVDSSRDDARIRGTDSADQGNAPFVRAVAEQITRLLDPHVPPDQPTDGLNVLATAGAALLSARTGEGESPATILRMARTG